MSLKVEVVNKTIVRLSAGSVSELGEYFLRFQEHYESPEWKGKIFTIGQFKAWYSRKYGAETYRKDWSGYNIPSYVLEPFIKGLFDPLTKKEQEIVNLFRHRDDKFYIIGSQDNKDTLEHEICHGLWYTNDKYRAECEAVLKHGGKDLENVRKKVASMMYHPSVIVDEIHAYMSANYDYVVNDWEVEAPEHVHLALRKIRKKYK